MLHSNAGELHQLFSTFNRVWGAGGDASLSLKTVDGKVSAMLEIQLGPPADLRPGAPEAQQQAAGDVNQQLGQQQRRRRRGPGRQARDAARRDAWRKRRQESQLPLPVLQPLPPPPPPPPPAAPPRRLVTIVKEKTSRSTFSQLDGEEEEPMTTPGVPPSPRAQVEFQCDKCDDAFNREFFLARHKKDVHNDWRLFTGLHWNRKPGRAALPELRL